MKNMILAAALVLAASSAFASGKTKCINRIEDSCRVSLTSQVGLEENVDECKQVSNGLEAVLLKNGKVSLVNTYSCLGSQYRIDSAGIKEMKVIDNRLFMLSTDGQVYFMDDDRALFEILNSRGLSYTTVVDIKGRRSGQAIELVFRNGGTPVVLEYSDLVRKALRGELRRLYKNNVSGFLGLFW